MTDQDSNLLVEVAAGRFKPFRKCSRAELRRVHRIAGEKELLLARLAELMPQIALLAGDRAIGLYPPVTRSVVDSGEPPPMTTSVLVFRSEVEQLERLLVKLARRG